MKNLEEKLPSYNLTFEFSLEDKEFIENNWKVHYLLRLKQGLSPQQTRYFLPNGLKTEKKL